MKSLPDWVIIQISTAFWDRHLHGTRKDLNIFLTFHVHFFFKKRFYHIPSRCFSHDWKEALAAIFRVRERRGANAFRGLGPRKFAAQHNQTWSTMTATPASFRGRFATSRTKYLMQVTRSDIADPLGDGIFFFLREFTETNVMSIKPVADVNKRWGEPAATDYMHDSNSSHLFQTLKQRILPRFRIKIK